MAYTVELSNRAKRALATLAVDLQTRMVRTLRQLEENPRPSSIKKMKGEKNAYRLRVGDYRILYEVHDNVCVVLVIRIGHRREVYRKR